jgi:hypothetical protein
VALDFMLLTTKICSFGVLVQQISRGLLVFFVLGVRMMLQARASKIVFGAGFDATTDKSNLLLVLSFGRADFPRNFGFCFLTGRTMLRASFDDFMWHRI